MLLFANKARAAIAAGSSVTSAAGQVAAVTTGSGALFVGVGGVATSTANPMRCVITAVDANGNDTGAFEIVEITRSGDNLTLASRGLEGTTAVAWGAGTVIECRPTAGLSLRQPQVLFRGIGRSTQATASYATASSVLPSGAPLSIPAGFLSAGDQLLIKTRYSHRGSATSTNWQSQIAFQTNYGGGTQASSTGYLAWGIDQFFTVIDPANGIASVTGAAGAGGFAGGGQTLFNDSSHFNLTTTALSIDFQAWFASAPSGTEAAYLDLYEIIYIPLALA
jgi:hypothetical protein